jgi:hypothetical protein
MTDIVPRDLPEEELCMTDLVPHSLHDEECA